MSEQRIGIAVAGAAGRMGQVIIGLLKEHPRACLAAALERSGHPDLGRPVGPDILITDDLAGALQKAAVLIDFTTPAATLEHLAAAKKAGRPIVIGTTGLSPEEMETIRAAGREIALLASPNMSPGVNLLFRLTAEAASRLKDYQVEIVEAHHDRKVDAPSGTALRLAEIVAADRNQDLKTAAVYGRSGRCGPRPDGEIGIHAIRVADVVGEHTVIFGAAGERLELHHRATSRQTFATGAIRAALFLVDRKPGFYSMAEVLGI
ncbi:MAG TPA: 4-hydroxy-tetrahydrodipicolinate reductase [bacterium]|uniref:4-hydroxy-tetrahydrodipicolinate reductase n=1 Tax=candidate division TA06 bacterium ADurb.Bin417 TaxID=1852828 RepID=A0A1V5MK27_UNCT6|nr:MAG: 4-hydroxy-tetrahydrodipicolinate reductase [candidate division TA06 bacterium ADurb.Bin417]HNQ35043.1 4-hydroxy-tetrahydrodipicolinate reductase [bacterium]HNS48194.1 4-hydroxy-tetrahydrodipicolinate reductase [bacterium]